MLPNDISNPANVYWRSCNARLSWWARFWGEEACIWRETKREHLRYSEHYSNCGAGVDIDTFKHEAVHETCARCNDSRIREATILFP